MPTMTVGDPVPINQSRRRVKCRRFLQPIRARTSTITTITIPATPIRSTSPNHQHMKANRSHQLLMAPPQTLRHSLHRPLRVPGDYSVSSLARAATSLVACWRLIRRSERRWRRSLRISGSKELPSAVRKKAARSFGPVRTNTLSNPGHLRLPRRAGRSRLTTRSVAYFRKIRSGPSHANLCILCSIRYGFFFGVLFIDTLRSSHLSFALVETIKVWLPLGCNEEAGNSCKLRKHLILDR
jgi:hypothetical protein